MNIVKPTNKFLKTPSMLYKKDFISQGGFVDKEIDAVVLDDKKIELIKRTICKGATNDELELFIHICKRTGLDPFARQIYSVPRGKERTIQVSIDGLRLIADRTGKYSPGKEPFYTYCGDHLESATVSIKKMTDDGVWHEVSATAFFNEYKPSGSNSFWAKMPRVMLSKVAESLALRKAFPAELSGIYCPEEMDQSQNKEEDACLFIGLNEHEIESIENLIDGDSSLLERILKGYKVSCLSEISQENYKIIVKRLLEIKKQSDAEAVYE